MVSSTDYKKLLKDHAKLKIIPKKSHQLLNEQDLGIIVNVKIKRLTKKINQLESKINSTLYKKDKVNLEMSLRKEKAKLKSINGD